MTEEISELDIAELDLVAGGGVFHDLLVTIGKSVYEALGGNTSENCLSTN
jgi:hypothetical protein